MNECINKYSNVHEFSYRWAEELNAYDFICTSNIEGACSGDQANPLVISGTLIGITSRGIECDYNYPSVYTRIYSHIDWIKNGSSIP